MLPLCAAELSPVQSSDMPRQDYVREAIPFGKWYFYAILVNFTFFRKKACFNEHNTYAMLGEIDNC